ncbi:MAG: DUF2783 domain-containing protein [Pseudomonadota bacterium]
MSLITTPNLNDADGTFADLLAAHRDLSLEESHALNARIVLVLANHIGDRDALKEAFALARLDASQG